MNDVTWRVRKREYTSLDFFLDELGDVRSVLDIGCGDGEFLQAWVERNVQVAAMDKDVHCLESLQLPPQSRRFLADWRTWKTDFLAQNFDLVYSCLGPDISSTEDLAKFSALSRKYCRLIIAGEGNCSLHADAGRAFTMEPDEKPKEEHILQRLRKLGYAPTVRYAWNKCQWGMDWEDAYFYLRNVVDKEVDSTDLANWIRQRAGAEFQIEEESSFQYICITWRVDQ